MNEVARTRVGFAPTGSRRLCTAHGLLTTRGRRRNARGLGQLRQEHLVRLAGLSADNAVQRRIGVQRRRVNPQRLAAHQLGVSQLLQHPCKDGLVRLHIDQPLWDNGFGFLGPTPIRSHHDFGRQLRSLIGEVAAMSLFR